MYLHSIYYIYLRHRYSVIGARVEYLHTTIVHTPCFRYISSLVGAMAKKLRTYIVYTPYISAVDTMS